MRSFTIESSVQHPIDANGNFSDAFIYFLRQLVDNRRMNIGSAQAVTIAGGVISVGVNFSHFSVDTEAAAASDNLDTINGGNEGDIIFIKSANSSHDVVIKDGTGNIITTGSADLTLTDVEDLAMLVYSGSKWRANLWNIT